MGKLTAWLRAPEPVRKGAGEVEAVFLAWLAEQPYIAEELDEGAPTRYTLSKLGETSAGVAVWEASSWWGYTYIIDRDGSAEVLVAKSKDGASLHADEELAATLDGDVGALLDDTGATILKWLEPGKPAGDGGYRLIAKGDDSQRYTLGVAYPSDDVDSHGDWTDADELEKAAWAFMASGQVLKSGAGTDHAEGTDLSGTPVESYIYRGPAWFADDGETVIAKEGDWMLGVVWADDAWQRIAAGELTGYSIQGLAVIDDDAEAPS